MMHHRLDPVGRRYHQRLWTALQDRSVLQTRAAGFSASTAITCLAVSHAPIVWSSFGSWLRTIRDGVCPLDLSPPSRCATQCPKFSSDPPAPQYSQKSCVASSIPTLPGHCNSPDRLKSGLQRQVRLSFAGKKGRREAAR